MYIYVYIYIYIYIYRLHDTSHRGRLSSGQAPRPWGSLVHSNVYGFSVPLRRCKSLSLSIYIYICVYMCICVCICICIWICICICICMCVYIYIYNQQSVRILVREKPGHSSPNVYSCRFRSRLTACRKDFMFIITACRKKTKAWCCVSLQLTGPYCLEGPTSAHRLAASRNYKYVCSCMQHLAVSKRGSQIPESWLASTSECSVYGHCLY